MEEKVMMFVKTIVKMLEDKNVELKKSQEDRRVYLSRINDSIKAMIAERKLVEKAITEEMAAVQSYSQVVLLLNSEVKEPVLVE